MDIGRLRFQALLGAQHAVNQRAQPVDLRDDDVGVFLQIGVAQLPCQQLCGAANPTQWVFHFVCNAFHNFFQCGLRLPLTFIAADGLQSINHGHLYQETAGADFPRNRAQRQIDGPLLPRSGGERNRSAHHGVVIGQRLIKERVPLVGFIQQLLKRAAQCTTGRDFEQVLCREVQLANVQVGVQQNDPGRQ